MGYKEEIRELGYAVFPGLVSGALVTEARSVIDEDLQWSYDPNREDEYSATSYCPSLRGTPPIKNLFEEHPVLALLNEVLGLENIFWDRGQIAIRRAHNHTQEVPPQAHLDGFASPSNGLRTGRIYSHTALLGIFLTPVSRPFAGNFTVWPRSHYVHERYFRERGPRAMCEPMPIIDLGNPVQLEAGIGDVVLTHYALGHTATVNTADTDRIAIFFRISLKSLAANRWQHLTHIWAGWQL